MCVWVRYALFRVLCFSRTFESIFRIILELFAVMIIRIRSYMTRALICGIKHVFWLRFVIVRWLAGTPVGVACSWLVLNCWVYLLILKAWKDWGYCVRWFWIEKRKKTNYFRWVLGSARVLEWPPESEDFPEIGGLFWQPDPAPKP